MGNNNSKEPSITETSKTGNNTSTPLLVWEIFKIVLILSILGYIIYWIVTHKHDPLGKDLPDALDGLVVFLIDLEKALLSCSQHGLITPTCPKTHTVTATITNGQVTIKNDKNIIKDMIVTINDTTYTVSNYDNNTVTLSPTPSISGQQDLTFSPTPNMVTNNCCAEFTKKIILMVVNKWVSVLIVLYLDG